MSGDRDLAFATSNACDQLTRYGGAVYSETLLQVLEKLTDINDDMQHDRVPALVDAAILETRELLDKLGAEYRKAYILTPEPIA